MVRNEEQPIDLVQAVKAAARSDGDASAGAAATQPSMAANGFPEPKRVRTVSVRPDGTIIPNSPAAAPAAPAIPAIPAIPAAPTRSIGSFPLTSSSAAPPVPAAPQPPAAAARPPAVPKATTRIASAKPEAADHAIEAARPKPASAPPAHAAASSPAGGFAVQLASRASENDARAAIGRLQKRYASELGSHRVTVVKALIGSKSTYRVRVVGLSRGDATTMCGSIKSSGGDCFVARN
jgi:hypothetical protein